MSRSHVEHNTKTKRPAIVSVSRKANPDYPPEISVVIAGVALWLSVEEARLLANQLVEAIVKVEGTR